MGRVDSGDVAAHRLELVVTRHLSGSLLRAQIECLATQIDKLLLELLVVLLSEIARLHHATVRLTKVVLTGSFAAASRNASRAIVSSTPSIS